MTTWFHTNQADSYWQRVCYVFALGVLSSFAVIMSLWWGRGMVSLDQDCSRAGKNYALVAGASDSDKPISIIFVGDLMLGRAVESVSKRHDNYTYPFNETIHFLKSADLTMGNLETPLTEGETVLNESMVFRADEAWAEALAYAGFDVLGLANNHMPNQNTQGITDTIETLDQAGILHAGAGVSDTAARKPALITVSGVTVGVLAYNDTDVVPDSYFADTSHAGTALMDSQNAASDIAMIRAEADWVIVTMHSGTEYTAHPNQRQVDFARTVIDAGADMVIGHHPHVTQSAEKYHGKYIFYSLGNFIFDQMWSLETRRGVALHFTLHENNLTQIQLVPVQIENFAQPHTVIDELIARQILDRLEIPYILTDDGKWAVDMSIANDY